jgi:hypothetical protein
MAIMAEVTVLILVCMGLLVGVVEVPQLATVGVESNKEHVVATWEVDMAKQMEMQDTLMHHGDQTLHKPPVVMEVLSPGRPNRRAPTDLKFLSRESLRMRSFPQSDSLCMRRVDNESWDWLDCLILGGSWQK